MLTTDILLRAAQGLGFAALGVVCSARWSARARKRLRNWEHGMYLAFAFPAIVALFLAFLVGDEGFAVWVVVVVLLTAGSIPPAFIHLGGQFTERRVRRLAAETAGATEGWMLRISTEALHYFRAGQSLCGEVLCFIAELATAPPDKGICPECAAQLEANPRAVDVIH